mgnify:CR=1 FL=1
MSKYLTEELRSISHSSGNSRKSILFLISFVVLIILATCFIRYSKRVTGTINLLPSENIYSIVSPQNGKIVLLKHNKSSIGKDQIVAYIENAASYEDVKKLKNDLKKVDINNLKTSLSVFKIDMSYALGEIQEDYSNLIISIFEYHQLYRNNLNDLSISNYQKLVETLDEESKIQSGLRRVLETKSRIMKENYERDSILNSLGTISQSDIEKSSVSYMVYKEGVLNNQLNSANNAFRKTEIKGQINTLNSKKQVDFDSKILSIKKYYIALLNRIKNWENNYLLKSSIAGTIYFVNPLLRSYEHVNRESRLFYILPSTKKLIGRAVVSSVGYGQIKVGQQAIVKVNDYPFRDYGYIKGKIIQKSQVKQDSVYYIDVDIPNGLKTNTGKKLEYYYNMSGSVEFITEKLSVFERLFDILINDRKFI